MGTSSTRKWELYYHFRRPCDWRRHVAFGVSVLLVMLGSASCFGADDSTPTRKGRVTIVYQDDTIQPANRDAIKTIMDSGVFERMADRATKAVALPHDLQVVVTDNVPKDVDDPTTEVDGRRIFWPAAFSKQTHDVLTEFLPEAVRDNGAPTVISQERIP